MHLSVQYDNSLLFNNKWKMALKDALQPRCFTLSYLYCTYSPAIAHPPHSPWFTFFLSLLCTVCSAFAPPISLLESLGIPGQRHVKAIRQKVSKVFFRGHWGESKRLQRSVTKTGRCCGSVFHPPPPPPYWHALTQICPCAHTLSYTEKQQHMDELSHTYDGM